ncbi:hypothetical protein GTO10_01805 [Candidatus Saccharibacteria bacterium]|nr:hypothetical protein [Candidatus Saccharibacteria bacterium]
MQRKLLPIVSVLVLSLLVVGAAFASGPAEKATGDVGFDTPWGWVDLVFDAHEAWDGRPAKGWLSWDRGGTYASSWSGPVVATNVVDNWATFTVRAMYGNPAVVGCDLTFKVVDGGEPGVGYDTVNLLSVVHSPGDYCAAYGQIQGPYTIDAGNLQVHNYGYD